MKKRVIAMLLAVVMTIGMVTGCGGGDSSKAPQGADAGTSSGYTASSGKVDKTKEQTPRPAQSPTQAQVNEAYDMLEGAEIKGGIAWNSPTQSFSEQSTALAKTDGILCGVPLAPDYPYPEIPFNTEEYSTITENPFRSVGLSPLSTFSADVDTASYSNLRRMIRGGYRAEDIPSGAVRTEEMLNYFSYDYKRPKKNEPFGVTAVISDCPWNEDSQLLVLGLQTQKIDFSEAPDSNLVFLIDVSGSMYDDNKLPLLKRAFEMLVENLGEKDRVSIVTYASSNKVVLEGVPGNEKEKIVEALRGLEAGGSTNGGEGILSAYRIAEKYFIEGGNNRVILATDGDLNVGLTSQSQLHDLVAKKKESGVFLSVLGFGMGNYSDTNMETLADYGNGNYAYIDSISEAKKVLVEEMGATLVTVAKDVKLQIEFNPAVVAQYRLIGYENRNLAPEDFADDTKDAGEIGAGHSVTVVYEIITCDKAQVADDSLKYQQKKLSDQAKDLDEWMTLSIRYKEPDEEVSKLLEYPIGSRNYTKKPSDDFLFAAAVTEFSMLLRNSAYIGNGSYKQVLGILDDIREKDEYRQEFYELVKAVQ